MKRPSIECFWLEPTERVRVWLRRYGSDSECSRTKTKVHDARTLVGEAPAILDAEGYEQPQPNAYEDDDPRWPTHCACGEPFADDERRQVFQRRIYCRTDTGEEMTLDDAPPGAMWDAWWMRDLHHGPDGRCLVVRCPDGVDWTIDGRATNCTLPGDNEHRCWVRTGEPPLITVGKSAPGQRTCAAGAGSIATPGYHGFLRDGRFT